MGVGATLLAGSLVLSACGGGDTGETEGDSEAIITVGSGEPQNGLIPAMTNEVFGGLVVRNIFSGLVYYDENGAVQNEVAESIESDDNVTWTITIEDGWTFTDGTPVTAQSFVDAWNWGAYGPNAANLTYFYEPIEGYDEVQIPVDKDGEPTGEDPEAETMSGLEVVSDTEFVVTLKQPESDFPVRLGYAAFFPVPESFMDDPEAFGESPVSNGPYTMTEWEHDSAITIEANPDYAGDRVPENGGIEFLAYTDEDSQYNDLLANNLDIVTNVPASAFATFEDELGDRAVNQPAAVTQVINVPEYVEDFQGEAGLLRRQAISMAIDREGITETVYDGARTPARDFTNPVIAGWSEDIPGSEFTEYNPEEAAALWQEAEDMDPLGDDFTLFIASNADSDHQSWIDPACNTIRQALEIECEFDQYPVFDEFLDARDNREIKGVFRGGWQADYPAMSNFLSPIYGKNAGSNDMDYVSEDFEAKMKEGNAAETPEEATELYKEAQEILFQDMPGIPLWYYNTTAGYAETVDNVAFGWDSDPILYQVTKSE
nr:ABC transporter substrate-binding protein [Myceligenerans xiligouense]